MKIEFLDTRTGKTFNVEGKNFDDILNNMSEKDLLDYHNDYIILHPKPFFEYVPEQPKRIVDLE